MNLSNEFQPIRDWAEERGIYEKGDPKTQTLKGVEEMGELAKAVVEKNDEAIRDAIGDVTVVLVSVAKLCGFNYEQCVNEAYQEIKNRKGRVENGTFIKYEGNADNGRETY